MRLVRIILGLVVPLTAGVSAVSAQTPTLRQIMADQEWVARSPENAYFSWDGGSVLFDRKREGSPLRDRWRVGLDGEGAAAIDDGELPFITARSGVYNADRSKKVFSRSGDVFIRDMATGELVQLTRTLAGEHGPMFMADGSVAFRRDGVWIIRDASTGLEVQAADIRAEDDPGEQAEKKRDYLEAQQHRLFEIIRQREAQREERESRQRARREADPTRVAGPFFIGKGWRIHHRELSPSGRWMLLSVSKDPGDEKRDLMPAYVNEDGYVSASRVRPKAGLAKPRADRLVLLDLADGLVHHLDDPGLPMIGDDPLAWLKDWAEAAGVDEVADGDGEEPTGTLIPPEAERADAGSADEVGHGNNGETAEDKPGKARPFTVQRVEWSPDGGRVAAMLRSNDNKDRWIVTVDTSGEKPSLVPIHHLRDEAWINWRYNEMGWTRDGGSLWFLSEHTGFGHLYLWDAAGGETRALTGGAFTVQDVTEAPGGGSLYFRSNRRHPGTYALERVELASGRAEQIGNMGGTVEAYSLSPDGRRVVVRHSTAMDPPELHVLETTPGARPTRLTRTDEDLFRSFDWVAPRFVAVPSSSGAGMIHCRVYDDPAVGPPREAGKPVVVFAHGAGYLQDAYDGWSYYAREHMFHTFLCRLGYIVIAPDFRASAGYGRDWRTAIYRDMGRPELEDFDDCLAWLDANTGADTARVGIYGGSYGGFLSLMAMFLRPEVYACGAALRPVTDWAHYNHGYTSNILNTPEIDPEAFERSSPIEHAEGLRGALLMCHGLLDDNVVAQDTVRLAQRLIELEKENWEMALYPVEPHGFREATGWLDEYRRIFRLFEANLKDH